MGLGVITVALAVVGAVVALAASSTDETVVSNAASSQETTTSAPDRQESTTSTVAPQETTTSAPAPQETTTSAPAPQESTTSTAATGEPPARYSTVTVAPELKSGTGFSVTYEASGDHEWQVSRVRMLGLYRDDGELLYRLNAAWDGERASATSADQVTATNLDETTTTARSLEMTYTLPTERLSGSYKLCGVFGYYWHGPDRPPVAEPFCRMIEVVP